ncbi:MAG: GGDEF domain-containing protein [Clostridiaceae bacterium]|nr:GGDEF domain-containing protein [Clostridiaceae bacterium]
MEANREEFIELINNVKFIEKTYDVMRVVDPIKKKILSYTENVITETDFICHHVWNKEKICDNCISLKAYKENDVFIKIEYHKEMIYMVIAIPVAIGETTVVIELFKDVSKNMTVVKKDKGVEVDIHRIIDHVDKLLLKDHLTGIYNRRFIDERLQVDIINKSIRKETLSVIMADIDLFKSVNDNYGHLAGDFILKEVANLLVSCVRTDRDWVARYGGEEFLICLPTANKDKAFEIAERMRKKIQNEIFEFEGSNIKVTTSFGVHTLVQNDESTIESIINFADVNLYKAKKSGRNMTISS